MSRMRSSWVLVVASVFFLGGSLSFLDDDRYTLGAWLFVVGSVGFVGHSLAEALAERRGSDEAPPEA